MIEQLEKAMERIRRWSPQQQAEAAELLLALDDMGAEPVDLTVDELAAIDEALAQAARGEIADAAEVEALFARYRP